ncbi:MAG TPA: two-component regulator propeller domain-containing protein [Verrucomicrobiae bacterium]|jgi:ligand-binding sensor domain-containing protein/signal transduction histidine kinase
MLVDLKRPADFSLAIWLLAAVLWLSTTVANGTVLWSDVGATLVHDTGPGKDILGGTLHCDSSSTNILYFKFHVNPLSDFHTEQYLAAFQLFEGTTERLGVGNAWDAWSYSALHASAADNINRIPGEFVLRSAQGSSRSPDGHLWVEYPVRDIERTIIFKVQYIPGFNAAITVWLNPNLSPSATEQGQITNLTTHFTANAAFNEIHLRHVGGGDGWIFSDMAIATEFSDFIAPVSEQDASIFEREKGGPPFEFQNWHREQGLPRESVYALAQSRQGYLWVGTDDGIARFDGVHFTPFGLREGLPAGSVRTLLEDHAGTLWVGTSGRGLARIQNGKVTTLTKREGLPGDVITALAEDGQGRLWIGTDGGLAFFRDGQVRSEPDEFKGKSITALFEDPSGILWVGVKSAGLYQHSGDKFTLFGNDAEQGLLEESHCLLVDHKGRLWVGAGDDCILCRDGQTWIQHRILRHSAHPYVETIAEGADGTIWTGSTGEGLMNFRKNGSQIVNAGSGLSDNFVKSLLCDAQGNLWIGTQYGLNKLKRKQLFSLAAKEGLGYGAVGGMVEIMPGKILIGKADDGLRLWNETHVNFIPDTLLAGRPQIRAMLAARDGSLWSAGAQGLWHFDSARKIADLSVGLPPASSMPIFPSLSDAYNLTAFCADGASFPLTSGIDRLGHLYSAKQLNSAITWNGSTFTLGPVSGPNAISSAPFSLPSGRFGALKMLATAVNGSRESRVFTVNYTDGTSTNFIQSLSDWKTPKNFPGEAIVVTMPYRNTSDGTPQSHSYYLYGYEFVLDSNKTVSSLVLPSNGDIIVLAVAMAPGEQARPVDLSLAKNPLIQLPQAIVNTLCEDIQSNIWAGTQEGELWQWHAGHWTMPLHFSQPVTSLLSGNDGELWVGTEGGGLLRLKDQEQTHYGKTNGLLSESIRALYFDAHGTLWIGTAGGGLSRLRNGNIATFTAREGLPDNTISQILEDDVGRLWLGTGQGIVAVMRDDLEQCTVGKATSVYPQLFGEGDGMPSEECTSGFFPAGLKTRSGLLCFSTQRGLVVADPHPSRNPAAPSPAVMIEQLAVDGEAQPWESFKSPLLFAPGNHQIEIRYTGLNFAEPSRVRFRYQLAGLDHGWVEAGRQRTASYNYVPPGKYQFHLQACGEDGVWTETENPLMFVVSRPFWKNWWFIGAGMFAALITVALLVRRLEKRRLRRRLEQLEHERAMERERTRIARDLHDEIGGKLCRISYLSKDAVRENGQPEKMRDQVVAIAEASRKVLQSLDEIVWAVNPQNDTLENLADYIEQMGPEFFETTGIECEVDIPVPLPPHPVSSQMRHHLFSAVHEAWANTLKHSRATRATVSLTCHGDRFEIVVADNGIGFDLSKADGSPAKNELGNGLRNMRQRLKDIGGQCLIQSELGRGTTLRFVIMLNGQYPK